MASEIHSMSDSEDHVNLDCANIVLLVMHILNTLQLLHFIEGVRPVRRPLAVMR